MLPTVFPNQDSCVLFFYRLIKDIWLYFGINTELFQVGSELRSKAVLSLPWNIDASLNFKDRKFEIDIPPLKEDFEVVCIRLLLIIFEIMILNLYHLSPELC